MTWFWSSPEWSAYREAYGEHPAHNFGEHGNLVVPLGEDGWSRLRHGHQSDIRRADRLSDEQYVIDRGNAEWADPMFGVFQRLHELDAGRKTRPDGTWDQMRSWLHSGNGLLVLARYQTHFLAAGYFITHEKGAYYASSARHPRLGIAPLMHGLIWRAMRHLADQGYQWLDMGPVPGPEATDKERAIAHFKRGFGAEVRSWPYPEAA